MASTALRAFPAGFPFDGGTHLHNELVAISIAPELPSSLVELLITHHLPTYMAQYKGRVALLLPVDIEEERTAERTVDFIGDLRAKTKNYWHEREALLKQASDEKIFLPGGSGGGIINVTGMQRDNKVHVHVFDNAKKSNYLGTLLGSEYDIVMVTDILLGGEQKRSDIRDGFKQALEKMPTAKQPKSIAFFTQDSAEACAQTVRQLQACGIVGGKLKQGFCANPTLCMQTNGTAVQAPAAGVLRDYTDTRPWTAFIRFRKEAESAGNAPTDVVSFKMQGGKESFPVEVGDGPRGSGAMCFLDVVIEWDSLTDPTMQVVAKFIRGVEFYCRVTCRGRYANYGHFMCSVQIVSGRCFSETDFGDLQSQLSMAFGNALQTVFEAKGWIPSLFPSLDALDLNGMLQDFLGSVFHGMYKVDSARMRMAPAHVRNAQGCDDFKAMVAQAQTGVSVAALIRGKLCSELVTAIASKQSVKPFPANEEWIANELMEGFLEGFDAFRVRPSQWVDVIDALRRTAEEAPSSDCKQPRMEKALEFIARLLGACVKYCGRVLNGACESLENIQYIAETVFVLAGVVSRDEDVSTDVLPAPLYYQAFVEEVLKVLTELDIISTEPHTKDTPCKFLRVVGEACVAELTAKSIALDVFGDLLAIANNQHPAFGGADYNWREDDGRAWEKYGESSGGAAAGSERYRIFDFKWEVWRDVWRPFTTLNWLSTGNKPLKILVKVVYEGVDFGGVGDTTYSRMFRLGMFRHEEDEQAAEGKVRLLHFILHEMQASCEKFIGEDLKVHSWAKHGRIDLALKPDDRPLFRVKVKAYKALVKPGMFDESGLMDLSCESVWNAIKHALIAPPEFVKHALQTVWQNTSIPLSCDQDFGLFQASADSLIRLLKLAPGALERPHRTNIKEVDDFMEEVVRGDFKIDGSHNTLKLCDTHDSVLAMVGLKADIMLQADKDTNGRMTRNALMNTIGLMYRMLMKSFVSEKDEDAFFATASNPTLSAAYIYTIMNLLGEEMESVEAKADVDSAVFNIFYGNEDLCSCIGINLKNLPGMAENRPYSDADSGKDEKCYVGIVAEVVAGLIVHITSCREVVQTHARYNPDFCRRVVDVFLFLPAASAILVQASKSIHEGTHTATWAGPRDGADYTPPGLTDGMQTTFDNLQSFVRHASVVFKEDRAEMDKKPYREVWEAIKKWETENPSRDITMLAPGFVVAPLFNMEKGNPINISMARFVYGDARWAPFHYDGDKIKHAVKYSQLNSHVDALLGMAVAVASGIDGSSTMIYFSELEHGNLFLAPQSYPLWCLLMGAIEHACDCSSESIFDIKAFMDRGDALFLDMQHNLDAPLTETIIRAMLEVQDSFNQSREKLPGCQDVIEEMSAVCRDRICLFTSTIIHACMEHIKNGEGRAQKASKPKNSKAPKPVEKVCLITGEVKAKYESRAAAGVANKIAAGSISKALSIPPTGKTVFEEDGARFKFRESVDQDKGEAHGGDVKEAFSSIARVLFQGDSDKSAMDDSDLLSRISIEDRDSGNAPKFQEKVRNGLGQHCDSQLFPVMCKLSEKYSINDDGGLLSLYEGRGNRTPQAESMLGHLSHAFSGGFESPMMSSLLSAREVQLETNLPENEDVRATLQFDRMGPGSSRTVVMRIRVPDKVESEEEAVKYAQEVKDRIELKLPVSGLPLFQDGGAEEGASDGGLPDLSLDSDVGGQLAIQDATEIPETPQQITLEDVINHIKPFACGVRGKSQIEVKATADDIFQKFPFPVASMLAGLSGVPEDATMMERIFCAREMVVDGWRVRRAAGTLAVPKNDGKDSIQNFQVPYVNGDDDKIGVLCIDDSMDEDALRKAFPHTGVEKIKALEMMWDPCPGDKGGVYGYHDPPCDGTAFVDALSTYSDDILKLTCGYIMITCNRVDPSRIDERPVVMTARKSGDGGVELEHVDGNYDEVGEGEDEQTIDELALTLLPVSVQFFLETDEEIDPGGGEQIYPGGGDSQPPNNRKRERDKNGDGPAGGSDPDAQRDEEQNKKHKGGEDRRRLPRAAKESPKKDHDIAKERRRELDNKRPREEAQALQVHDKSGDTSKVRAKESKKSKKGDKPLEVFLKKMHQKGVDVDAKLSQRVREAISPFVGGLGASEETIYQMVIEGFLVFMCRKELYYVIFDLEKITDEDAVPRKPVPLKPEFSDLIGNPEFFPDVYNFTDFMEDSNKPLIKLFWTSHARLKDALRVLPVNQCLLLRTTKFLYGGVFKTIFDGGDSFEQAHVTFTEFFRQCENMMRDIGTASKLNRESRSGRDRSHSPEAFDRTVALSENALDEVRLWDMLFGLPDRSTKSGMERLEVPEKEDIIRGQHTFRYMCLASYMKESTLRERIVRALEKARRDSSATDDWARYKVDVLALLQTKLADLVDKYQFVPAIPVSVVTIGLACMPNTGKSLQVSDVTKNIEDIQCCFHAFLQSEEASFLALNEHTVFLYDLYMMAYGARVRNVWPVFVSSKLARDLTDMTSGKQDEPDWLTVVEIKDKLSEIHKMVESSAKDDRLEESSRVLKLVLENLRTWQEEDPDDFAKATDEKIGAMMRTVNWKSDGVARTVNKKGRLHRAKMGNDIYLPELLSIVSGKRENVRKPYFGMEDKTLFLRYMESIDAYSARLLLSRCTHFACCVYLLCAFVWRLTPARHARIFGSLQSMVPGLPKSSVGFPVGWSNSMVEKIYGQNKRDVPEYFQAEDRRVQVGLPDNDFTIECLVDVIRYVAVDPLQRTQELVRFDSDLYRVYLTHMDIMAGEACGARPSCNGGVARAKR